MDIGRWVSVGGYRKAGIGRWESEGGNWMVRSQAVLDNIELYVRVWGRLAVGKELKDARRILSE